MEAASELLQWIWNNGGEVHPSLELRNGGSSTPRNLKLRKANRSSYKRSHPDSLFKTRRWGSRSTHETSWIQERISSLAHWTLPLRQKWRGSQFVACTPPPARSRLGLLEYRWRLIYVSNGSATIYLPSSEGLPLFVYYERFRRMYGSDADYDYIGNGQRACSIGDT